MGAIKLDGTFVAKGIRQDAKQRVDICASNVGEVRRPKLVTIYNSEHEPSCKYVNMKEKACELVGLKSIMIAVDTSFSTQDILNKIEEYNVDPMVCGILVQHPLPQNIDEDKIFDSIALEKDVDGLNSASFGKVAFGEKAFKPATPEGIISLLKYYDIPIKGKNVVVIGKSRILGLPLSVFFMQERATVISCNSATQNLQELVSRADIVVGAVGKNNLIDTNWVKDGATIVDAGNGDFTPLTDRDRERLLAYTEPRGGVGPMTIATLVSHTADAFVHTCQEEKFK